ncbi:uncharacterized protein LOC122856540 [Aphidius gifuensis]|uniref:uncharacterized protein LOC122856540 n=1 Tax=Aphidius gifuensis TaxID=684658 RepID=UPI001CDCEB8F|nr:uncharacterized protein LOC122856540 [Aphidius gifuensis]
MESEKAAKKELDEPMEMDYDSDSDSDSDSDFNFDSDLGSEFDSDSDSDSDVCEDWKNEFLSTCLKEFKFNSNEKNSVNEIHEKANDLKYVVNLCGTNLTRLDVKQYPISQIMPIINANCPNLKSLSCAFKEIMSQDFENCFSNMSKLKKLSIEWQCENSTPLMTLAKSIEQTGGTLKCLKLSCTLQENDIFSPDSLASVFPRLTALTYLNIFEFGLSQLLLESISKMNKLTDLLLKSGWPENHPMFDTSINMYPIGNMKNLKWLYIDCDYGITDEFLINLCNNAKKLTGLSMTGTNITDTGISAINNLEKLDQFSINLGYRQRNEFITDESIQCLFNQKLDYLDISNCINVTDKSVTYEAVEEIQELGKQRNKRVNVRYSFEVYHDYFRINSEIE